MHNSISLSFILLITLSAFPFAQAENDPMKALASQISQSLSPKPEPEPTKTQPKPEDEMDKIAEGIVHIFNARMEKAPAKDNTSKVAVEISKPVAKPAEKEATKPQEDDEDKGINNLAKEILRAMHPEKKKEEKKAPVTVTEEPKPSAPIATEEVSKNEAEPKKKELTLDEKYAKLVAELRDQQKKAKSAADNSHEEKKQKIAALANKVATIVEKRSQAKNANTSTEKKSDQVKAEVAKPTQSSEHGFEASTLKTSDRCSLQLSQTIPALNDLAQAASQQDVQKVEKEFNFLKIVSHALIVQCHGSFSIVMEPKAAASASKTCHNELYEISQVLNTFISHDSKDKSKLVKTLNHLWVLHSNFVQSCLKKEAPASSAKLNTKEVKIPSLVQKKSEDEVSVECVLSYAEVVGVLHQIAEKTSSQEGHTDNVQDIKKLVDVLIGEKLGEVNKNCGAKHQILVDEKSGPIMPSTCQQDYKMFQAIGKMISGTDHDNNMEAIAEDAMKMVFIGEQIKAHC